MCRGVAAHSTLRHYGDQYMCIPRVGSGFSFCTVTRNGGVGNTWFFRERIMEQNERTLHELTKSLGERSDDYTFDKVSSLERIHGTGEFQRVARALIY